MPNGLARGPVVGAPEGGALCLSLFLFLTNHDFCWRLGRWEKGLRGGGGGGAEGLGKRRALIKWQSGHSWLIKSQVTHEVVSGAPVWPGILE